MFRSELIEIKGKERIAVFQNLDTKDITEVHFDGMHATPHMFPNSFIKESGLASPNGFAKVDSLTLQSSIFPNVFAVGDCADLPTSKTLSAVNE